MPVAYRLIELPLPSEFIKKQNLSPASLPRVPVSILTISGSEEEYEDVRNEYKRFSFVLRDARRFENRPNEESLRDKLTSVIFAGYLSGVGKGDSYVEWALSGSHELPNRDFPDLYKEASRYSSLLLEDSAVPISGSIPLEVVKLAEYLKKHKAYGFTSLLIGGGVVLGHPLSPFLVLEAATAGTAAYAIIAIGTAATERVASYVKDLGLEKHRPERRRVRRRRR